MFALSVIELLIVLMVVAGLAVLVAGIRGKQGKQFSADEAQVVQEIYHSLSAMEKRIEALETVLLDRAREGREDVRFRS